MSSSGSENSVAGKPRVLVFGVGNTFYGDDGIGYCMARAIEKCGRASGVEIVATQTLGPGHSMLLEDYDYVVFIDAYYESGAGQERDIVVLELDPNRIDPGDAIAIIDTIEPHSLNPLKLLVLAKSTGFFHGKGCLIGITASRLVFNEPLSEEAIRRGVKALEKLVEVLEKLGKKLDVDKSCVEDFLRRECQGPLLD